MALTTAALVVAGGALNAALPAYSAEPRPARQPVAVVGYASTDAQTLDRSANQASRDAQREALERARLAKLERAADQQATQRNARLADLAKIAEKLSKKLSSDDWVLPTSGYQITAGFGQVGSLWESAHSGLDMAAVPGTPVVSVASGVVVSSGYSGDCGNRVAVILDDGGTSTLYCHLDTLSVRAGDEVIAGQQLGTMGSTGHTTGPHLHFEVRTPAGDRIDPYLALVRHGLAP